MNFVPISPVKVILLCSEIQREAKHRKVFCYLEGPDVLFEILRKISSWYRSVKETALRG
jgi:hypothetical protein